MEFFFFELNERNFIDVYAVYKRKLMWTILSTLCEYVQIYR
jgi:hypothetical protein